MKKIGIKHVNDFILAVAMLALSAFLIFYPDITTTIPKLAQGGFFTRADVYIRMLAVILLIASGVLLIRSLTLAPVGSGGRFHFLTAKSAVLTAAALIVYTLFLPWIGFFVSSFLMIVFLNLLYCFQEKNKGWKEYSKQESLHMLLSAMIYSLVLMLILWLVFSKLLGVRLP